MIRLLAAVAVGVVLASGIRVALAQDATLPATVKVAWDMSKAWRETTPTQERICINGLWRFRPADSYTEGVPAAGTGWGYFKVPGPWPQGKEQGQAIYGVEPWVEKCGSLDACWSSREITVPAEWNGRSHRTVAGRRERVRNGLFGRTGSGQRGLPGGRTGHDADL